MSLSSSILIRTPGYWPLPKFVSLYAGGKWLKLTSVKLEEKKGEYNVRGGMGQNVNSVILEAQITSALPKKIILTSGAYRFVLSRWIGGLYSNLKSSASQSGVRSFYDAIAPKYKYHVEPGRDKQLGALARELAAVLPSHARVLDASAGNCTFAKEAVKLGLDVWCNDISAKMMELGGNVVAPSRRSVASASRLPFPPSSFDAVVHTYSNIHPSDKKFFASFWRVLKKDGLLLYHPVKAPGEQWPKDFEGKTRQALLGAGFSSVARHTAQAKGARRITTLVFYLAKK